MPQDDKDGKPIKIKGVHLKKGVAPNIELVIVPPSLEGLNKEAKDVLMVQDDMAAALKELNELLGIGKRPNLKDELGAVSKSDGSVLDRIKTTDPPQVPTGKKPDSIFSDPLPPTTKPRSSVVGPSNPSTSGMAGQDATSQRRTLIVQDRNYPNPIRYHYSERGDSTAYVEYDATTGNLIDWGTNERLHDGSTRSERSHVEESEGGERMVIVEKTITSPSGERTTSTDKHPYGQDGDFPLQDPVPRPGTDGSVTGGSVTGGSVTGDEVSGDRLPLGIQYNPITGQYTKGMKLNNNQVNPGKTDAIQDITGPKLTIDPKNIVINPDPSNMPSKSGLKRIEPIGPGGLPPKEDFHPGGND